MAETLEAIQRQIDTLEDLNSIVRSMKALAAVNIRQYQEAVRALREYNNTVDMGFQILLRQGMQRFETEQPLPEAPVGLVVFGSDQGLCGQLNERVAEEAQRAMATRASEDAAWRILAMGERVEAALRHEGHEVHDTFTLPSSRKGITGKVDDVISLLERWRMEHGTERVLIAYSRYESGSTYKPFYHQLLPFDWDRVRSLHDEPWPTSCLPQYTADTDALLAALVHQYLFIGLYQAFADSLASENASRLAAMQRAEKNLDERLDNLVQENHQQRQRKISEELLDIVSGFTALRKKKSD